MSDNIDDSKLQELMKKEFFYPELDDPDLQYKLYKKREFYYNRMPPRKKFTTYEEIKDYRDRICGGHFELYNHQSILSNFINPNTPYKGLLLFWGVGTGKTCGAISIAENFKETVKKYNTKIYILTSGPLLKEQWKNELINCTKETYMKDLIKNVGYVDDYELEKAKKNAINIALQYYKIINYQSFHKKVIGHKITERRSTEENKVRKTYRKSESGVVEREISIDKIDSLDNTLLIVDEAHNLTNNEWGDALIKVINNSKNLKVLLLSATPMKNLASDIIELLNFIRPKNDKILKEKVFTSQKVHLMKFKPGGEEYLRKMANGYVSYYRGANPLIFAERDEIGEIPDGLIFTKLVRCQMEKFQKDTYLKMKREIDDSLNKKSEAVANFVFPGLTADRTNIMGYFGNEGINIIKSQLKNYPEILLRKINDRFFDGKEKDVAELLYDSDKLQNISGSILKIENLKMFSTKFYEALNNINQLVDGKKGPQTAFVYSNLVKVGIELFQEIMLQNGYLEYNNDGNYSIKNNTKCYYCGQQFKDHTDEHQFYPATFITITGKSETEGTDTIPEFKKQILDNIFNNIENKEGKNLKFVLGSRIMTEGINMENIGEVHILDVHHNLGKVHQVIGRAIRQCKHYKVISDNNKFPKVSIYKYAVKIDDMLSTEEELYRKAELKYLLVKQVERILKEVAIDCPLNYNSNVFPEERDKYKDCQEPDINDIESNKNKNLCPGVCDFATCSHVCYSDKLNLDYYDRTSNFYKNIPKEKLDYTTFTNDLARNEIDWAKEKIKELYRFNYVYSLDKILKHVKKTYIGEKKDLFDDYFVYKGLDELIPITENEFNNFKDTLYDKYNVPGYLIYRHTFYIFQPFDQKQDVPMYYRSSYNKELLNELLLYSYIKNTDFFKNLKIKVKKLEKNVTTNERKELLSTSQYDFESVKDYYDSREEFIYVGIIDKTSKRYTDDNSQDVFKLRPKREHILLKKRGTGVYSIKGSVCSTSKSKEQLLEIAKEIKAVVKKKDIDRLRICDRIKERLLFLEKYSTTKQKNKITYIMIPNNHPIYKFPFNLEDRYKYIIQHLRDTITVDLDITTKTLKNGIFEGKRDNQLPRYLISVKDKKEIGNYKKKLEEQGFKKVPNYWQLTIE